MVSTRKKLHPYGLITLGISLIAANALFMLAKGRAPIALPVFAPSMIEKGIAGDTITYETAPERSSIIIPPRGVPVNTERKITKTAALDLLVERAETTAGQIADIAKKHGGFVVQSQIYEKEEAKTGTITIKVLAASFERALGEIKAAAIDVERETINASDVTEHYVDFETRLENLKAQEKQYLAILKTAKTVADTLNVTQYLNQVRGEIDQIKGQLQYLANQVDMSEISATLTAESEVKVFGVRWKPLLVLKQSLQTMLTGISAYIDAMIAILFYLPVLILWGATIGVVVLGVWKIIFAIKRNKNRPAD